MPIHVRLLDCGAVGLAIGSHVIFVYYPKDCSILLPLGYTTRRVTCTEKLNSSLNPHRNKGSIWFTKYNDNLKQSPFYYSLYCMPPWTFLGRLFKEYFHYFIDNITEYDWRTFFKSVWVNSSRIFFIHWKTSWNAKFARNLPPFFFTETANNAHTTR